MPEMPVFPEDNFVLEPHRAREFHISQWIEVVRRRRTLVLIVLGIVLAAALVQYAISPKLYRSTTVIQIERRGATLVNMQRALDMDDWFDAQSFFPTQLRLLQSRGLAERVVRSLRLADDPFFNPARASLLGSAVPAQTTAADDQGMLAALAFRVLGGLQINPVRNTRLVEISYSSTSPVLAAKIANGVAEAFIDWGVENRSATAGKASTFLTSQIEAIKQEIQDKEASLQAYGRRSDIVALDPASNVTLQRLEGLNHDYVQAVSERINHEARFKELQDSPREAAAEMVAGPLVAQLRGDLMKLEREYATKLNVYKPEWPAMQELKAQIDKGRQHFESVMDEMVGKARDAAKAEYQAALRREESLTAEMTRQKADAMRFNSAAVEYNNLKVEVSTRRILLDDLLRKQAETEVASHMEGSRDSNVMVVDRALIPWGPYSPSLLRSLMMGLILGLGLGLGVVFLLEYLDRTIKTTDDVERVLGLPLLGVVPDLSDRKQSHGYYRYGYGSVRTSDSDKHAPVGTKNGPDSATPPEAAIELLPHVLPRSAACEAYRSLRTALLLSAAGGLKTVVVTSAMPGEGKTVTAVNLAVVLAQLDREVLVVDSDLRKPRLHEIFRVSNRIGLVNHLVGSAEPVEAFLRTAVPHLYLAPSGPVPPNPSELLASDRMQEFITLARQRFDFVLFDSPPVLVVTDSTVLGAANDGVVLCLGAGQVLREDAVACRDRLHQAGVKVLGVALNRFRAVAGRAGSRYAAYHGYGYGDEGPIAAARPRA
jgi:succinoglycan biosynthesis transport protein ExoP